MTKKERLSRSRLIALSPPIDEWALVPDELVSDKFKELFRQRCKAIKMYYEGSSVKNIQQITSVVKTSIPLLYEKCLQSGQDGRILGYTALIPYYRTKDYVRAAKAFPKLNENRGGLSGVFRQTLNKHPEIEARLKELILKINSTEVGIHEKKIATKALHKAFLKMLKNEGVEEHEWPFSTKYLGLNAISKYLNETLDQNFARGVRAREEQAAIAHLAVGAGYKQFISFEEPYEAVQFDAYLIDSVFSAEFDTPEGYKEDIQLSRLWLITLIECISRAILSYAVVYRSEISSQDLIEVLRRAIDPAPRPEITIPGLQYEKLGGLPWEVIPESKGAVWNCIFLDGALAHLANTVKNDARANLGFTINWGPVAHFERRSIQERFFNKVATDIFKRFPSTTGSNPFKGRAKNAEENAVKYKLRAEEAEQLLAIYIAQYNATPNEGTSYLSPLDILEQFFKGHKNHYLPRYLPVYEGQDFNPIPLSKVVRVGGGRVLGRRPYIEYEKGRYTNDVLMQAAGLVGKKIRIEIDDQDLRQVKAYLLEGGFLGYLKVMGRWSTTKHSLKTRKIINSLIFKKKLILSKFEDPIPVYFKFVSLRNKEINKKNKHISPKNATEATRVAKESGLPRKIIPPPKILKDLNPPSMAYTNIMPTPLPDLKKLLAKKS